MKAREQIRGILLHHGWHAAEMDPLLDSFAHELAEDVRKDADRRAAEEVARFGRLDHESELHRDGMRTAADLIDPKAQRASTEGDNP